MPNRPKCSICAHRECAAIDLAIAMGVSVPAIARRYGASTAAIYRHRDRHLSPTLRAQLIAGPDLDIDLDRLKETESQSLLANLVSLRHRLFHSLGVAEECGDGGMISRIASQLHQNFQMTGQLLQLLGMGSTSITTNILIAPQYITLRVELMKALEPYKEARLAVAAALHQIESKASDAITADKRELAK
jgi:transposase-like protein